MRFFGKRNPATGVLTFLTFPDGRPIPFPFIKKQEENAFSRELRRVGIHTNLVLQGYSYEETHGRTSLQITAVDAFQEQRSLFGQTDIIVEIEADDTKGAHMKEMPYADSHYVVPDGLITQRAQPKAVVESALTFESAPAVTIRVSSSINKAETKRRTEAEFAALPTAPGGPLSSPTVCFTPPPSCESLSEIATADPVSVSDAKASDFKSEGNYAY
jgi:hypothetical protein